MASSFIYAIWKNNGVLWPLLMLKVSNARKLLFPLKGRYFILFYNKKGTLLLHGWRQSSVASIFRKLRSLVMSGCSWLLQWMLGSNRSFSFWCKIICALETSPWIMLPLSEVHFECTGCWLSRSELATTILTCGCCKRCTTYLFISWISIGSCMVW